MSIRDFPHPPKRRLLLAGLAALACAMASGPARADAADDAVSYFRAVQLDNVAPIKRLLAKGLDPNIREPERGETGLIVAMRYDSNDTLNLLLAQPGIDMELRAPNGNTALMMAAFRQNKPALLSLIARGAQVNQTGWTALHYAAAAGSSDLTSLLLAHHAHIDAESPSGMTPLMMAAREGMESVVALLLKEGADASLKDGGFHLNAA